MSQHAIHVGMSTFYQGGRRSQAEWESAIAQLLKEGRPFVACDLARTAMDIYPHSVRLKQMAAQGLTRTGALEEARNLLEPLCNPLRPDRATLHRLYNRVRDAFAALQAGPAAPQDPAATEELVGGLFEEVARAVQRVRTDTTTDEESLGLLGRVYKDLWCRGRVERDADGAEVDLARLARDTYRRGFRATSGIYTGINAAAMSRLIGEDDEARAIAARVLEIARAQQKLEPHDYWTQATIGEAHLLLGQTGECLEAYRIAAELYGTNYAWVVSSIQQLRLLQHHGLELPEGLIADRHSDESVILQPPTVVLFSGHMIDWPGQQTTRFPNRDLNRVRGAIEEALAEIDARIGYSSAACGSDLLFVEAMLARGAEIHLVLPFHIEDFVDTSVRYAGEQWVRRFHRALRLATSVKYATEERCLGDDALFAHGARMAQGLAELRSSLLETRPVLLAVHDQGEHGGTGGTAAQLRSWPDGTRKRVIDLCELTGAATITADDLSRRPAVGQMLRTPTTDRYREVKTLLFADVVGYSRLQEEETPFYMYEFLRAIAEALEKEAPAPRTKNTWGDAIFVVMDQAVDMAEYALALQRIILDTDWRTRGFSADLSLRIALHAGPVFSDKDPITGHDNHYGSHVNRAARIEPITSAGCIYASEQFVTMLAAELVHARERQDRYAFDYVGTVPLAKKFGSQTLYQVRRANRLEARCP